MAKDKGQMTNNDLLNTTGKTPVSSTNKTDRHDITEILLKVALNTINQPNLSRFCIGTLIENAGLNQFYGLQLHNFR
jgi:hypothetical protein